MNQPTTTGRLIRDTRGGGEGKFDLENGYRLYLSQISHWQPRVAMGSRMGMGYWEIREGGKGACGQESLGANAENQTS
jgi:hypothetical protein